ncbi:MAG TPA: hypothetical protein VHN98_06970 [Acidimicrobiales bacterium]|nr:hypothetical protein [Acidimicrobiales bacterium]
MPPSVRERLQAGLPAALKARDAVAVSVLRTTLAAIANAEAVDDDASAPARGAFANEVARRALTEDDVREIVAWEHTAIQAAAAERRRLGRAADAEDLEHQAEILGDYLA